MADFYAVHWREITQGMRSTNEGEYFKVAMQVPFCASFNQMNPTLNIVVLLHGVGGKHFPADKAAEAMISDWNKEYAEVAEWGFPD